MSILYVVVHDVLSMFLCVSRAIWAMKNTRVFVHFWNLYSYEKREIPTTKKPKRTDRLFMIYLK